MSIHPQEFAGREPSSAIFSKGLSFENLQVRIGLHVRNGSSFVAGMAFIFHTNLLSVPGYVTIRAVSTEEYELAITTQLRNKASSCHFLVVPVLYLLEKAFLRGTKPSGGEQSKATETRFLPFDEIWKRNRSVVQ